MKEVIGPGWMFQFAPSQGVVHRRTNRDLMYRDATRGLGRNGSIFNAILQMLAPIGGPPG